MPDLKRPIRLNFKL